MSIQKRIEAAEAEVGKIKRHSFGDGFRLDRLSIEQLRQYRKILERVELLGDTDALTGDEQEELGQLEYAMAPERIRSDPAALERCAREYDRLSRERSGGGPGQP
jgi:hypothetical protein